MKAILFDWDGTIVDSIRALYGTDEAVCRRIGVPFNEAIFRRTFSPNWRRMYDALGITKDRFDDAERVWSETFRADLTLPFDGVVEALARLGAADYTLGIVTGGSRSEVEPQLGRLGLDKLLTVRVYAHHTPDGKPHPSPLLLALDMCGPIRPDEAIYVGDALDDVRMAAAAGVRGVGIVSMLATADELIAAGAVETAGSVAEWVDSYLRSAPSRGRPRGTSWPEPGPRV